VAQPHDRIDGEIQPIQNASVDVVAAAGSVWSSVHDMSRWARFLLRGCRTETGEVLLKPATCAELFQPQTVIDVEMYPAMRLYDHMWLTYGLGWFQTDYRGRALDFHSGSIDGLVALIGLMRSEGLGVYVLANLDHAEVRHALLYQAIDLLGENLVQSARRDWNREIKQLYDGLQDVAERNSGEPAGPRVVDPRPPRPGGDYSGSYVDPIGGSIEVVEESGGLQLHWGRRRCTLRPVDADRFMCPWEARWRGEMPLEFEADDSGTVVTLELGGLEFGRQRTEAN
jgi:CubicO group peptidase (beta-lactamase class C family)